MVETVGIVVGVLGTCGLAELARRSWLGVRWERSLAREPVRVDEGRRSDQER